MLTHIFLHISTLLSIARNMPTCRHVRRASGAEEVLRRCTFPYARSFYNALHIQSPFSHSFKPSSEAVQKTLYQENCNLALPMETETETKMEKQVMVVGIDDSEHSYYALSWALDHFFAPFAANYPFKLLVVHAKPSPTSVVGFVGPAGVEVLPTVELDLKRIAVRVIEKAKELCISKSVTDAEFEIVNGDARNVLCEAVEKHHATMLVVGSHGYGAIKRAVIGSVSDYCAHHAHCSVMIVKKPKVHKHH